MSATEEPVSFRPVFCHRDDCDARRERAFCSACGADIAAYVNSITSEQPTIAEQLRVMGDPQVPVVVTQLPPLAPIAETWANGGGGGADDGPPMPTAEEPSYPPPGRGRRVWRHPLVLVAFAASFAAGAGIGLLAGLA